MNLAAPVAASAMAAGASARLQRELKGVNQDETSGVRVHPVVEGDLTHMIGTLEGPDDSPFEGAAGSRFAAVSPT